MAFLTKLLKCVNVPTHSHSNYLTKTDVVNIVNDTIDKKNTYIGLPNYNTGYAITTTSTGDEDAYTNAHSINSVTATSFKIWNRCAGSITIRWIAIGVVSAKHLLKQLCDLFVLKEVQYV